MANDMCNDNRFEVIGKAKEHLLEATNIETSPDEMAALDSFLFRCWQMGWLKQYDEPVIDPIWINAKNFVDEIIHYIFAYPDDDYMTIEFLCRKLHKHGLINKKDGEWNCNPYDGPMIEYAPVRHGKWEEKSIRAGYVIGEWQEARCSTCGGYHTTPYMYYFDEFTYCPNCGAKMNGGVDYDAESTADNTPRTERPCDNCQEWDCYGCDYKQTEREDE